MRTKAFEVFPAVKGRELKWKQIGTISPTKSGRGYMQLDLSLGPVDV